MLYSADAIRRLHPVKRSEELTAHIQICIESWSCAKIEDALYAAAEASGVGILGSSFFRLDPTNDPASTDIFPQAIRQVAQQCSEDNLIDLWKLPLESLVFSVLYAIMEVHTHSSEAKLAINDFANALARPVSRYAQLLNEVPRSARASFIFRLVELDLDLRRRSIGYLRNPHKVEYDGEFADVQIYPSGYGNSDDFQQHGDFLSLKELGVLEAPTMERIPKELRICLEAWYKVPLL